MDQNSAGQFGPTCGSQIAEPCDCVKGTTGEKREGERISFPHALCVRVNTSFLSPKVKPKVTYPI